MTNTSHAIIMIDPIYTTMRYLEIAFNIQYSSVLVYNTLILMIDPSISIICNHD